MDFFLIATDKLLIVPPRSSALPNHKTPSFSLTPGRHNRDSPPPPPSPLSKHTQHSFVSLLDHSPRSLALNFSYVEKQNIDKTKQNPLCSTAVTPFSSFKKGKISWKTCLCSLSSTSLLSFSFLTHSNWDFNPHQSTQTLLARLPTTFTGGYSQRSIPQPSCYWLLASSI